MLKITSMRTKGCVGKIKAYFAVSFGDITVNDLRLIEGVNGPFVAFPSRGYVDRAGEKKYAEVVSWARTAEGQFTTGAQTLQDEILALAQEEFQRRSGETLETASITPTATNEEEDDDLPF